MTKPMGGTEILFNSLSSKLDLSGFNIVLSYPWEGYLSQDKPNIMWQHNESKEISRNMYLKSFQDKLESIVFVSGWQYEQFINSGYIEMDKAEVIKNAIEPIEFLKKPKDKIKLIYTSTPHRGLEVLLDVFEEINRDDLELDVYSSTTIYGEDYAKQAGTQFDALFDRARNMKNVNYHGQGTNAEVRSAVQSAHIMAYPSIFKETSCLAIIEAAAAGCEVVSTYYGAIPETTAGFATLVPMGATIESMKARYKEALLYAIDNLNQEKLKKQSDYFNAMYSWETRLPEWERLLAKLSR